MSSACPDNLLERGIDRIRQGVENLETATGT